MDKDPDYTADLAAIIDETLGNGGNVIIPSFAVGRTQELLYFIREMKEQHLVKSVPGFSVVVDSPGRRGHPHLLRGSPRLSGRGGHRRPQGRGPVPVPRPHHHREQR